MDEKLGAEVILYQLLPQLSRYALEMPHSLILFSSVL
jgi:hypothetical protein